MARAPCRELKIILARFPQPIAAPASRTFTPEQLEHWLDSFDPPAAVVSMIDGYLAARVVSLQFIPPEDWSLAIVGDRIVWALEGIVEATVRNTCFNDATRSALPDGRRSTICADLHAH